MAINGLAIQHDANHGSFSKNYYINWIAGFIDDVVCGGSSLLWRHQHVVSHHLYPNDVEKDTDTYSNFPLLRLNPSLGAKWYNKYQHYYYPLLYGFLGIAYYVDDVRNFLKRKYLHVPMQPLRTIDYVAFFWWQDFVHAYYARNTDLYTWVMGWNFQVLFTHRNVWW
jgi:fatty acid desaturase